MANKEIMEQHSINIDQVLNDIYQEDGLEQGIAHRILMKYSEMLADRAAERREKELLIIADELEKSGWTMDRYLKAWLMKMEQENGGT